MYKIRLLILNSWTNLFSLLSMLSPLIMFVILFMVIQVRFICIIGGFKRSQYLPIQETICLGNGAGSGGPLVWFRIASPAFLFFLKPGIYNWKLSCNCVTVLYLQEIPHPQSEAVSHVFLEIFIAPFPVTQFSISVS